VALTEREREVLKLLAEGYDVETSANLLAISPATVRKHREHLHAKLKTSNTAHLTLIAVRRGIVVG
jgi:DNA-binding CsgD family transcriptional regulator